MDSNPDWITTPVTADLLRAPSTSRRRHGLLPHRLPAWARAQAADGQLAMVEAQPSGVRLVLPHRAPPSSSSTCCPPSWPTSGAPPRPDGVYDLLVDGAPGRPGERDRRQRARPSTWPPGRSSTSRGRPARCASPACPTGDKDVEIWLPHNETTELVALRTDAPVEPSPDRGRRVWLHHGSSISQGSERREPHRPPGRRSPPRSAGWSWSTSGFGGSALLDPFTARAMRDTPADLISVKIGINLVNTDVMRLRAFAPAVHGFLDTIREGHPTTPLLVVSPILCPIHEDTPGPSAPDFSSLGARAAALPGHGRPGGRATGKLTLQRHPRRAGPDRGAAGGRRPAPALPRRPRRSTARPTPPSCRCPTSCTRTPRPTAASASGSRHSPSARGARSPVG